MGRARSVNSRVNMAIAGAVALVVAASCARAQLQDPNGAYGAEVDLGGYGYGGPVPVCAGECVETYAKCSGKNIDGQRPCCSEHDQCVFKNDFYSQCRPVSKGIPVSWENGRILDDCTTTTDPVVCDDSATTFKYHSAEIFTTLTNALLNKYFNFEDEEACKQKCLALEDCSVYEFLGPVAFFDAEELDLESECSLFDASVISGDDTLARPRGEITTEEGVTPSHVLAGVKCFYPTVCGAGEVQDITSELEEGAESFWMAMTPAFASTRIEVGATADGDDVVTACANLCAMSLRGETLEGSSLGDRPGVAGVCQGFAIDGDMCTLLYPEGASTVRYTAQKGTKLYSIGGCAATDPVIEEECADNSAISFQYQTAELLFTVADTLAVLRNVDEQMCADACLDREGCVVYEWRDAYAFPATDSSSNVEDIPISSVCSLFDANTIPNNTQGRPRHAGVNGEPGYTVAGLKCYYPEAACEAPEEVDANGEYFMAENELLRNTQIVVGPGRSDIFIECANLCMLGFRAEQLEGGDAGVCSGFAIDGDLCTMLYPEGGAGVTVPYVPGNQAQVYSVEQC